MAFVIPEMVQETTDTTGTSDYVLSGAVSLYRAFSNELNDGDVTLYTVFDNASPPTYEINRGTYTLTGTTLARSLLIKSSTGAAISWGASTKNVVAGIPGRVMRDLFERMTTGQVGIMELKAGAPISQLTLTAIGVTGRALLDDGSPGTARTTIDAQEDVIANRGALVVGNSSGVASELTISSTGLYLGSDGTDPAWRQIIGTQVTYNATTPLTATDVQTALDQLAHPKGSVASVGSIQTISTTAITGITSLVNLTPPGTPDGTKLYAFNGQVTMQNFSTDFDITFSIHKGTTGDETDAIIASYFTESGNRAGTVARRTAQLPRVRFTCSSSDRISVSIQLESATNVEIKTTDSWAWLEQVSNA